jgi:type I restriction enzyme S subunit
MDTKKLRQKILDLAIHGKLVPQDPNDEPASVLLERIRTEKERLVKEGKIKKSKASKTSDTPHYENVPFEVPISWEWTTVNAIAKSILYGVSESAKTCGKYKLLRITDIQNNNVQWDTVPYSDFDTNKAESYLLNDGDILFARTGATVGKSYLVQGLKEEAIYASYLIRVQTYDAVLPQYVKFYFESGYYWEQIVQESVGVGQPNVNGTILGNLNIPIPPIHEQDRIVSELSKWMGIIDVIEQGKIDLQTVIKEAKSKILDLAIHGKLIPQDPNDEPASELLKRINPNAEITCDNGQYGKIPENWCITRIKNAFLINPRNKAEDENNAGFVPMTNICDGYFNRFTYETKKWTEIKTGFTHFADGDIAVAKISPCLENRKSMVLNNLPNGIGAGTTELHVFRPLCVAQSYGLWFFKSDYFVNQCVSTFNGVVGQQRVGKNIVEDILFPLPPLAEQHRIAAKIEEIFSSLNNIQKALEV